MDWYSILLAIVLLLALGWIVAAVGYALFMGIIIAFFPKLLIKQPEEEEQKESEKQK